MASLIHELDMVARIGRAMCDLAGRQRDGRMTKATGRLVLMVALLALIVALGAAQLFLPLTGLSLNLEIEEAGLGGALIAGLSAVDHGLLLRQGLSLRETVRSARPP